MYPCYGLFQPNNWFYFDGRNKLFIDYQIRNDRIQKLLYSYYWSIYMLSVYISIIQSLQMEINHAETRLEEVLTNYSIIRDRLHQYLLKEQSIQNCKSFKITNNQKIEAYEAIYNYLEIRVSDKSQKPPSILQRRYRQQLTNFCKQLKNFLINLFGTNHVRTQLEDCYIWIIKYTKFCFVVAETFKALASKHISKNTSLHFEALDIFRQQVMEPLLQNIIAIVMDNLQAFRENKLREYSQLQYIIQLIASCGLKEKKHIALRKAVEFQLDEQYRFISFNRLLKAKHENEYLTIFFKQKFVERLKAEVSGRYKQKAEQMLMLSTPEYIEKAMEIFSMEEKIGDYFYPCFEVKKQIIKVIQNAMIVKNAEILLTKPNTGFEDLCEKKDENSLKKLYKILKRCSLQKLYVQHLQKFASKRTAQILNEVTEKEENEGRIDKIKETIESIHSFAEFLEGINRAVYDYTQDPKDLYIIESIKQPLQHTCDRTTLFAKFLVYYIDHSLKKIDTWNTSAQLTFKVSKLIKFILSIDYFLKIYQKALQFRILEDVIKQEQHLDNQNMLIQALKVQFGASAVNQIIIVLQDCRKSQEITTRNKQSFKGFLTFTFNVKILTSGSWLVKNQSIERQFIPEELSIALDIFQGQYLEEFNGRKLKWNFNYGKALIEVSFNNGKKILRVNSSQLLILLYLQRNKFHPVEIGKMKKDMRPEENTIFMKSINFLIEFGVLKVDGASNQIQEQSIIQLCSQFIPQKKTTGRVIECYKTRFLEKNFRINQQLTKWREEIVQALVVKVMKSHKQLQFNELIREATRICKQFQPSISTIKKAIEICINKGLMQRLQGDFNTLVYKS